MRPRCVGVSLSVAALIAGPSLGQLGGKARIEKITPEKHQEIARNAARARWAKGKEEEITSELIIVKSKCPRSATLAVLSKSSQETALNEQRWGRLDVTTPRQETTRSSQALNNDGYPRELDEEMIGG